MEFLPLYGVNTKHVKIDITMPVLQRMYRNEKEHFFQKVIIEKQLNIFNLTREQFEIIKENDPEWEKKIRLSSEQYFDLSKFGKALLNRLFRWNKKVCATEWGWFSLNNTLPSDYE